MVKSEQEMVRKNEDAPVMPKFTSLQAEYEDSVEPETEWELEDSPEQR